MRISVLISSNKYYLKKNSSGYSYVVNPVELSANFKNNFRFGFEIGSVDLITIKYCTEEFRNIRLLLRFVFLALKEEGQCKIVHSGVAFDFYSNPFRSRANLLKEVSLVFRNRVFLHTKTVKNAIILECTKKKVIKIDPNYENGWSFCITSGGSNLDKMCRLIRSIQDLNIPLFEVLIAGPEHKLLEFKSEGVEVLDDTILYEDERIPINKKKNLLVNKAKYRNLVIIHDRFVFPKEWYTMMLDYGLNFELLTCRILDLDTKSIRVQDWMGTSMNQWDYEKMYPKNYQWDYSYWSVNWNWNGGFIIGKRDVFLSVPMNNLLNWGEEEDGNYARILDCYGYFIEIDSSNWVYSSTERFNTHRGKGYLFNYWAALKLFVKKFLVFSERKLQFYIAIYFDK